MNFVVMLYLTVSILPGNISRAITSTHWFSTVRSVIKKSRTGWPSDLISVKTTVRKI